MTTNGVTDSGRFDPGSAGGMPPLEMAMSRRSSVRAFSSLTTAASSFSAPPFALPTSPRMAILSAELCTVNASTLAR